MALLNWELSDLILSYDSYGIYLDEQGRTTDLEKKNFQKGVEELTEVWNSMVIDQHEVVAQYVQPVDSMERSIPDLPSPQWYSEQVYTSYYLSDGEV